MLIYFSLSDAKPCWCQNPGRFGFSGLQPEVSLLPPCHTHATEITADCLYEWISLHFRQMLHFDFTVTWENPVEITHWKHNVNEDGSQITAVKSVPKTFFYCFENHSKNPYADLHSLSSFTGLAPFLARRDATFSASPCSTAASRRSSFLFHSLV